MVGAGVGVGVGLGVAVGVGFGVPVGVGLDVVVGVGVGVEAKTSSTLQSRESEPVPPVEPHELTAVTSHLYVLPETTGKDIFVVEDETESVLMTVLVSSSVTFRL